MGPILKISRTTSTMYTDGRKIIIYYLMLKSSNSSDMEKNLNLQPSVYPKPNGTDIIEEKNIVRDLGVQMNTMSTRFA